MRGGFSNFLALTVSAVALNAASSAAAADAPDSSTQTNSTTSTEPDDGTAHSDSYSLQEILVTAQYKSENLQKSAIPVAVVSSDTLSRAGVSSSEKLTSLVPALSVSNAGTAGMVFFLRGVGNFSLSSTVDSAVAFNYDNVYIGRPTGTAGVFYDLERIEVLKGPQGTLYGRNATAGAINVIPNTPKLGTLEGYLSGTYGNYNAAVLEGAINLPLGSEAALRISGNLNTHDGYLSDGTSDGDTKALRVQVAVQITPNLNLRLSGDFAAMRGAGGGASYIYSYSPDFVNGGFAETPSGLDHSLGLYDPKSDAFRTSTFVFPTARPLDPYAPRQTVHNDYYGLNGEINLDTGAGILTVIPAWRYVKQDGINSVGFLIGIHETDEQYSLETRFNGNRIGIFDYTIGAQYFHEHDDQTFGVSELAINVYSLLKQTTESYAGFARVTANISDSFRLVGGARYTHDRKAFNGTQEALTDACSTFPPVPCFGAPLLPYTLRIDDLPAAFLPPEPTGAFPTFLPTSGGGLIVRTPKLVSNSVLSKGRVTWRAAAEFDVAPRSLIYASVETGFRAGGLQVTRGYESFAPEKITAYTIGSKNRFMDNRVQLNLEGFLWKYKAQQLAGLGIDRLGNPDFFTRNIGSTTSYGFDAELQVAATETTRLSAQLQYLHTKYDHYIYYAPNTAGLPPYTSCAVAPAADPVTTLPAFQVDCSGMPAYNAPKWTLNIAAEQVIPVGDYQFRLNADTQYRTSRWIGFEFQPGMLQGPTWQSNAQISFGPSSERWLISGFVRNIENNRFVLNAVDFGFASLVSATTNPPRTYGVQGRVSF